MASLKTFSRVLTLDPANWYAKFCAGDVQRTLGLLDAAVKTFNNLIEVQEGGAGVEAVLAETLLLRARAGLRTGHRGRAEADIEETLRRAVKLIKSGQGLRVAWKVAADVLVELGTLEDVEAPSDIIAELLDALTAEDVDGKMGDALEALPTVAEARIHAQVGSHGLLLLALSAYKMRLLLESVDDPTSGPSWFDLGLATHRSVEALTLAGLAERADNAPREAVFCFRQALRKEPRNPIYWTALGVAAGDLSPRLAQHALIKAAEINPRSAVAWTHLGLFYLQQADLGLANEAFLKAQTLDPEHAPAWLGQAALASLNEDETNAGMLIEHAWLLGGPPNVALAYGTRIANSPSPSLRAPDALFCLTRYLARRPRSNATALHAHGLLSERLGLLEQAVESLSLAVASLEAEYERTESATIEHRYALAQANLARVRLAISAYGEAEEAATSALGLLPEESASRGHAMLIKGLAQVLGENVEGIQTLEDAAGLAGAAGARSALVLAKALWQNGSEEQKEEAKRHLLAQYVCRVPSDGRARAEAERSIADAESGQPNLPAVASLGAAAMLTNDEDLLDAAVSEVANVSADKKALLDPTSDVTELLVSHALLKVRSRIPFCQNSVL